MDICLAELSQAEELTKVALLSKAYWGYSAAFMEDCKQELTITPSKISQSNFSYFVARQSHEIAGFYALEWLSDSRLELEALFVLPEFIGQGVGKSLFHHAMLHAKNMGAKEVEIQGDPNAQAFYLAMGATLTGHKESLSIPDRLLPLFKYEIGAN